MPARHQRCPSQVAHDRGCPRDGGVGEDDPGGTRGAGDGHGDPPRHYHQRLRGCRVHVQVHEHGHVRLREARRHPGGIQAEAHGRALRRRARELLVHRGVALQGQVPRARGRGRARYQLGPRGLPGEARRHRGASRGERGGFFVGRIRRRRRLRRRRGGQGRQGQARSRARRVRGGGPGVRGEGGERPGRSVRQQVPEGLLPVAQRRGRVVRSSSAQEARLRGEVPAAVLSHQRHRGEVRQGPRDGGGRGPAARLPEPPVPGVGHAAGDAVPEQADAGRGRGCRVVAGAQARDTPVRHVGGLPQAAGTRGVRGKGVEGRRTRGRVPDVHTVS